MIWGYHHFRKHPSICFSNDPYAPIPSASGLGVGFRYLNTFSQGIWSTRGIGILISWFMKQSPHNWVVACSSPAFFPNKKPGDPNCSLLNCIDRSSWWRHFWGPLNRLAKKQVIFQPLLFLGGSFMILKEFDFFNLSTQATDSDDNFIQTPP